MNARAAVLLPILALLLGSCAGDEVGQSPSTPSTPAAPTTPSTPSSPAAAPSPTPSPSPAYVAPDPRWRFHTDDSTRYASPWYAGRHPIMIGFGCTSAPWYASDPRCPGTQGFHHGIDIAIPCGETLTAGVDGRIVTGGLGAAYGSKAFRIRTTEHDLIVAHAQEVLVGDGDRVTVGQPIAEVGALGAPDGCHLHLEQRSTGGWLATATDPSGPLALRS